MSMSCYMCNLEGTVSWQDAAAPQQTTKKTKAKASSNTDSQQQMIPAISFGLKYPATIRQDQTTASGPTFLASRP